METLRNIVSYHIGEYGCIKVKLADMLEKRNITRNALSKLTGIKYPIVTRYYNGEGIERVDLDVLAKFCYALNCDIADLLEYEAPKEHL